MQVLIQFIEIFGLRFSTLCLTVDNKFSIEARSRLFTGQSIVLATCDREIPLLPCLCASDYCLVETAIVVQFASLHHERDALEELECSRDRP